MTQILENIVPQHLLLQGVGMALVQRTFKMLKTFHAMHEA